MNFPPKQIANIMSECLVLGGVEGKKVTLINPDQKLKMEHGWGEITNEN